MADQERLSRLLEDGRTNAVLAWLLTGFLGLVAARTALDGGFLWAGFTATVIALAVAPPVVHRSVGVMLPWEVLALGSLPILWRSVTQIAALSRVATYLSVAALALVVAVELSVFTRVRMPEWFAVLFVVVATMATAGAWTVAQWLSDVYLDTAYLLTGAPESEVEAAVMWDFVAATVTGLLAGVIFEWYFRRRARTEHRLPEDVVEVVE